MKPSHMLVLMEIKHVFQGCAAGGEPASMVGLELDSLCPVKLWGYASPLLAKKLLSL